MVKKGCWRFFVYIMASKSRVLYTGMTNNLSKRVCEHKNNLIEGFTTKYRCHRLVYFASFDDVRNAINREKQIKAWTRAKRVALIESTNPTWEDLAETLYEKHQFTPEKQVPRSQKALPRDDTHEINTQNADTQMQIIRDRH
jgi:putative endonuclease